MLALGSTRRDAMTKRSLPPLDEHCPIPILRIDDEGIVCAFNAAAAAAFGLTANRRRRAVSLIPELKSADLGSLMEGDGQADLDTVVDDKPLHLSIFGMHQHKVVQVYCVPVAKLSAESATDSAAEPGGIRSTFFSPTSSN